jgi:hypothetical protein
MAAMCRPHREESGQPGDQSPENSRSGRIASTASCLLWLAVRPKGRTRRKEKKNYFFFFFAAFFAFFFAAFLAT